MKSIFKVIAVTLFVIVFGSCGTFPKKPSDRSIVVIGIKNNKNDFEKYYVYFRLYYSDDDYIRIDPAQDRSVSMKFEPGDYEIIAIEPVYFQLNRPYRKVETHIPFRCVPNGITILRDAISISFQVGEDGYLAEHAEFTTLSDEEYMKLVEKIQSDKNAKYWGIVDD